MNANDQYGEEILDDTDDQKISMPIKQKSSALQKDSIKNSPRRSKIISFMLFHSILKKQKANNLRK